MFTFSTKSSTFSSMYRLIWDTIYNIPTPSSISFFWNFGSLLGVNLLIQIVSGIFLSFYYTSSLDEAFFSVISMMDDYQYGWLIRSFHANGASFFFFLVYLHIGRGLYYKSFKKMKIVWLSGVTIFLLLMMTAFVGYVLPWGQMSLWGATVITNLLSAIPFIGEDLVIWIWGGFSVSGPTLMRFFSIHYLCPLIIVVLVLTHLLFLHSSGSSNPLGLENNSDKIFFHHFFTVKDLLGMMFIFIFFLIISLCMYDMLMDPDNFSPANPMSTPPHIQPEWYFLFAYSILRSVPSKLGGVMALVISVVILFFLPFMSVKNEFNSKIKVMWKIVVIFQFIVFLGLTWAGSLPVESPFVTFGKILSIIYFMNFFLIGTMS